MHALYVTKDLLFSARVCSLARAAGVTVDVSATIDASRMNNDTTLVMIDLGLPQLDIAVAVGQLRAASSRLKIVAYGPHVESAMLVAAEQAGCDLVLPRSQFDRQIAAILRESNSSPADTDRGEA